MVVLALASGVGIGFVLGLIGAGGSILALPLLVYVVGVPSVHIAIGTSAIAVALNALTGLAAHARQGNVKWPCAITFATAGVFGALAGAELGKAFDGQKLLALFGVLMVLVGLNMLRPTDAPGDAMVKLTRTTAPAMLPWLIGIGFSVGLLSGFFGIGGGFLIVPGIMLATGLPLHIAVGTSLVAVSAFGIATASSYAWSGKVDWLLAVIVVCGGVIGALAGVKTNGLIGERKRFLSLIFACVVIAVGLFVAVRGISQFL